MRPVFWILTDPETDQGVSISCWADENDTCYADEAGTIPLFNLDIELVGLDTGPDKITDRPIG